MVAGLRASFIFTAESHHGVDGPHLCIRDRFMGTWSSLQLCVPFLHVSALRFLSFPQGEDYGKCTTGPQCSTQREPAPATGEGSARAPGTT